MNAYLVNSKLAFKSSKILKNVHREVNPFQVKSVNPIQVQSAKKNKKKKTVKLYLFSSSLQ